MRSEQTHHYSATGSSNQQPRSFQNGRKQVQKETFSPDYQPITLGELYDRLRAGFTKILVAIKFHFYRLPIPGLSRYRVSWFKLGLLGILIFILTKKDIQFSVNMKAPFGNSSVAEVPRSNSDAEQMSLAQSVSLKKGKQNKRVVRTTDLDEAQVKTYIERFKKLATIEMDKYGIPASIKLGQAILESQAGQLPEAIQNNNHFGTPFKNEVFGNAWESWRAHSELLFEQYRSLFENGYDYREWAKALQRSEYTTDGDYAEKLIHIIENYQLYQLDEF
ncbi:MAG TPA: glucosaminidase domain-containing protein [Saprospiraceae bacterium]|nr:glucosaminidase domain-containing protein [Saprospiraceae bacterium]HMQ84992.1 glucosaminidase domain-containing protein [Saprospiraceae bacterium]